MKRLHPKIRITAQETYNLADTNPESANNLRHEWVKHQETNPSETFYVITDKGQIWAISPDAEGQSLLATPVIQKFEMGEESAIYPGADAWNELQEAIGDRFSLWPPKKEQEDIEQAALKVVGRLVEEFERK